MTLEKLLEKLEYAVLAGNALATHNVAATFPPFFSINVIKFPPF